MSSHSPYFIDWSDDRPDELTLMRDNKGWVEFRNLKGVDDLRYFLEDDQWGQKWVSEFFRADFADEPIADVPEDSKQSDDDYPPSWNDESDEPRAGES